MGANKPETAVVEAIMKWLEDQGGGGFKVYGNQLQRGGEPDIDGQYYSQKLGRWIHLKIEAKFGDGVTDPRQDWRLEVYRRRDYCVCAAWGVSDVRAAIAKYETEYAHTSYTAMTERYKGAMTIITDFIRAWRTPNELHARRLLGKACDKAEEFVINESQS